MKFPAQEHFSKDSGFTLVELLLVVSLIAVLSSLLIPGFSTYIDNQNIRQAQEILKSDLRTAQNNALTGVGSSDTTVSYWGLKIPSQNATNYGFFKSAAATPEACDSASIETIATTLPGNVVVKDASGACVFFSARNGDALFLNYGNNDTLLVGRPGEETCFGVQVNSAGMVKDIDTCN